jgi:hypothetical protein
MRPPIPLAGIEPMLAQAAADVPGGLRHFRPPASRNWAPQTPDFQPQNEFLLPNFDRLARSYVKPETNPTTPTTPMSARTLDTKATPWRPAHQRAALRVRAYDDCTPSIEALFAENSVGQKGAIA